MVKMKTILILLSAVLIVGCSPIKRMNRLIDMYPELAFVDTIYIQDTFITESIHVDTHFSQTRLTDTVFIERENIKIRIWEKYDTIYLNADVESDTIIVTKTVTVEKIKYVEKANFLDAINNNWWIWLIIILLIILGICKIIFG